MNVGMSIKEHILNHPELGVFFTEEEKEDKRYLSLKQLVFELEDKVQQPYYLLCNIFMEDDLAPIVKEFKEIVNPTPYITEEICGYRLDGLKRISNNSIKELFYNIVNRNTSNSLADYIKENRDGYYYVNFVHFYGDIEKYRKFSDKIRRLYFKSCSTISMKLTYEYMAYFIPGIEDKCLTKVTKWVLKKFLEDNLGLGTSELTKILLLINDDVIDSCQSIVNCYKYWNVLDLRVYDKNIGEYFGENHIEKCFGGNNIYNNLVGICGDKLVQAMNKHKEDIISLTCRELEIYNKIDDLQFVLENNKVYIRYHGG